MERFACVWVMAVVLLAALLPARAEEGAQQFADLGRCTLDSGQTIEHCRVGYRTFGTLNAAGDNAVLMPTWLNGRTEDLLSLVGPAPGKTRLVDSTKYYAVLMDALGDGVSSSPSNSDEQKGASFPAITERDMVRAEYRTVTEVLHLKHARAIVGISMGAEQTFEWAVTYPEFFNLAVPIIGTPQLTSYDLLSHTIAEDAMLADPDYKNGKYGEKQPSLKLANELLKMELTTPQFRAEHTDRKDFPALLEEARKPERQDANDRMWQLKAVLAQDVLRGKSIEEVAKASRAKWLVIVSAHDHLVYPAPALAWAKAVGADTYISDTPCGHQIMECDAEQVSQRVEKFLAQ
ncbi:MAG TPA: alpha/beta hydrolase [Acidobacteriaceae bacterium]|jgi:homoserine O-acetyltransferase|nr:alpha/beta hydrolase [Acidobacteriaceae bacterium]